MSKSTWKTGAPIGHTGPIGRVTRADLLRQLGLLGLIGTVWLIVVGIALNVTGAGAESIVVNEPDEAYVAVPPTDLPPTAAIVAAATLVPTEVAPTVSTPTVSAPTKAASPAATVTGVPTHAPTSTPTKPAATATSASTATTAAAPTSAATAATGGSGAVSFSRDVKPILDRVCVKCHGGEETKEGLVLKSYAELMAGSFNGPVVVPGDTANSLLIELITNGKMPKKGPKLLPAEIRAFTNWVAAGAKND
jgi:hypothetical protein